MFISALRHSQLRLVLLTIFISALNGQESEPVRILHPRHNMLFYVDTIQVAGDIPTGTQLFVMDSLMIPDQEGRFTWMLDLHEPSTDIFLREENASSVKLDTIRVYHNLPDHMTADSLFINNNIPDSLILNNIYPRPGKFYGSAISLRGKTHPNAILLMNGDTLMVWPSGAFTSHVEINPGENKFLFQATLGDQMLEYELLLQKPEREQELSSLDPATALPRRERWLRNDEYLSVGIQGPSDQAVFYKVPGVSPWKRLNEQRPGEYRAELLVNDIDDDLTTQVQYRIGWFSRKVVSAPVSILLEPVGAMTINTDTRVYDMANTDQLLFPLADSVNLQIVGFERGMYRIKLGEYRTGYVRSSTIALRPESRNIHPKLVGSLQSRNSGDWAEFRIRMGSHRLPFSFKEKAVPSRLELLIYGAKQGWEWTTYPDSNEVIAFIERSQPEDQVWQMDFYPSERLWGWSAQYEGDYLVLKIRKAPEIVATDLFANIKIEIDPGHGGWERGARGITGYAEADANLRYSHKLAQRLRDAGAQVFMTRSNDSRLSLAERAEIARQDSVHIFVMAHNNAPGSSRDILEAKGSSTFYTWPSSKALSDHIYPYLGEMGIDTSGKVNRYYYYLTRQTDYLVYLIEGGFMTYPPEEMFLLSEEGLEALAQAAFKGLEAFLQEQAQ